MRTGWQSGPIRDADRTGADHPSASLIRALDQPVVYSALTLVVFATVWQIYGTFAKGLLIPTFTETMVDLGRLLFTRELWEALWISNQAMVIGFAIAVVIGVPVGLLLGRFRRAERYLDVYLSILLVTPLAAIIPLLVISVGFGLLSRVILVTLFAVVMIIVSARAGVRQVDPSLIQMARSFGADERRIWQRVLVPGAMPSIMTGLRLGLGRAVQAMVIVELLMVSVGIGGLILKFRGFFQPGALYAVIIIVVLEAVLLVNLMAWLERRLSPSTHTARGASR
ncbi:ABC transporter permease [Devosia sp. ZW T5_3]|uniref:ABC transporter permease n=1 Tax=Devosia sp. ZW T5_3 TaxID=3378085 RepID=UPI003853ADE1